MTKTQLGQEYGGIWNVKVWPSSTGSSLLFSRWQLLATKLFEKRLLKLFGMVRYYIELLFPLAIYLEQKSDASL